MGTEWQNEALCKGTEDKLSQTMKNMMTKLGALALAGMLVLAFATSCDPEDKPDNNGIDISLAYGTWQCDTASMNGQLIFDVNLRLTLSSDFTGEVVNNGYLPFYGTSFIYAISGNSITITPPDDNPAHTFTIEKLTASSLQFSGSLDNDIPAATFYFHKATSNPVEEQRLIGHWSSTRVLYDGEEANESMLLDFYENHTGLATFDETQNSDFTWTMNGDKLTVIPRGNGSDAYVLTVRELSASTLHFSGMVEMDHNEMQVEGWFARMMTD